jgi:hypothetical protein
MGDQRSRPGGCGEKCKKGDASGIPRIEKAFKDPNLDLPPRPISSQGGELPGRKVRPALTFS